MHFKSSGRHNPQTGAMVKLSKDETLTVSMEATAKAMANPSINPETAEST